MLFRDRRGIFEVGDSAGDLDGFEVGAGREIKRVGGGGEEFFGGRGKVDRLYDFMGREGAVEFTKTGELKIDSLCNGIFYSSMLDSGLGGFMGEESGTFNLLHIDIHINTVKEGARELFLITFDFGWGTSTFVVGVTIVTTRAGVHGGDKHEVGRVGGFTLGTRNGDLTIFKWLTQGLEDVAVKFGKLVEKENAVSGERDFTRKSEGATADNRRGTGGMVGRTEGASRDDLVGDASEGIKFGGGNLLLLRKRRKEIGGGLGKKSFASAWGTREENVVMAGNSDSKCALGEGLADNMVEKGRNRQFFFCFCIFYSTFSDEFLAFEMKE